ncbi:unnamed protein product [Rhizophagus irregularis]|nr:unnamed protein product [Rhizophagus irregularis]
MKGTLTIYVDEANGLNGEEMKCVAGDSRNEFKYNSESVGTPYYMHNVSIDENLSLIITVNDQTYEWSLKEVFTKPEGVEVTLPKKGDKIILTLSYRKYKIGDSHVNRPDISLEVLDYMFQ